jgi:glycosyltransferase involved in cell wall biosynthesis
VAVIATPRVSVVIPAFNAERTLARAVDSVLAQQGVEDTAEIIVCDDGSTDRTAEVLEQYGDRLVVVRQENRGRGAARNACLARARGEFIAFLDADDKWVPRRLAIGLNAALTHPDCDVFYGNALVMDGAGTIYRAMNGEWHVGHSGWVFPYLLRHNFVPLPTVLVRRTAVDAAGWFDESLRRSQDLEWLLRLSVRSRFHYDHTPLAWVDDRSWATAEKKFDTYDCYRRLLEQLAKMEPALVARHGSMYRKSLCDCHTAMAAFREEQGDYALAAAGYAAALSHAPTLRVLHWKRCLALYRAGETAVCERALRDLLDDDEYHCEARFYLGTLLLREGRNTEAVEQLEQALYGGYRYQKFPECLNNLAVALERIGERDKARELLEQAIDQQRYYSDAIANLESLSGCGERAALKWTSRKVF